MQGKCPACKHGRRMQRTRKVEREQTAAVMSGGEVERGQAAGEQMLQRRPRAYANGSWTLKPDPLRVPGHAEDDIVMHQKEDALGFVGLKGCASSREFWWHLAADNECLWDRFPAVTSWDWTPGDDYEMRPSTAPPPTHPHACTHAPHTQSL
ncbi:uncharacterized protein C8Q71DRAFT_861246 [Rhodofomes roseus]|uniref:Uncharacterized protein n=1 Tax=Rhodofomes roseus TaxID=34475 RepID=A0ABQ8K4R2_9APHY|nr:uncharacterized protein C8Q71DRAFT_861246 [Rhodofomes roseus]KAH9831928.1 hypothetical protein C8Q71DRAFT_861246 [Rhodofomes roseus]